MDKGFLQTLGRFSITRSLVRWLIVRKSAIQKIMVNESKQSREHCSSKSSTCRRSRSSDTITRTEKGSNWSWIQCFFFSSFDPISKLDSVKDISFSSIRILWEITLQRMQSISTHPARGTCHVFYWLRFRLVQLMIIFPFLIVIFWVIDVISQMTRESIECTFQSHHQDFRSLKVSIVTKSTEMWKQYTTQYT